MQVDFVLSPIPLHELREVFRQVVQEELSKQAATAPEKYLSQSELAKLLGLSKTTIISYAKAGRLKPRTIQGRVWYLQSEVQASMDKLKPYHRK